MSSVRLAARRPAFRCLNAPIRPRPHLRQAHTGRSRLNADLDKISIHRDEQLRQAALIKRRNWLTVGALLSMLAPVLLIKFYDLEPEKKDGQPQQQNGQAPSPTSQQIMDLVNPTPTKTDSPKAAVTEFQGKKVVVAAGDKIIAAPKSSENPTPSDVDSIELVETGTSYVPYFPKTLSLPSSSAIGPEGISSEAEYTLLGLGIRRVSFLSIQVYIVGLYVKNSDLAKLQNHLINTVNPTASALIPGEKEELRTSLLDAEKSTEIWRKILERKGNDAVNMAFRIVPVRGTDFKHLQDGWMRGITSRTDEVRRKQAELLRQQATESKTIALPKPVEEGEFADESFGLAMKDFKSLFQGRGKAPKGSVIILSRDKDGVLGCAYQSITKTNKGEKMGEFVPLGEVKDPRVSRLVWELYLGGKNVSSEEARKNIVDGCISIVERPVGTVENMIL